MFNRYFGDKKRDIVDKKIKKQNKFKLVITDWIENILTKKEEFFDDVDDAKREGNKRKGSIKIYDRDNHLIHSQKNEEHHGKGHHHEHHHDDDDDLYA